VAKTARREAPAPAKAEAEDGMTLVWFIVWLILEHIGDKEPLLFRPVNVWTATLLLAIALDINRPSAVSRRQSQRGRSGTTREETQ
jgi:hypothetical protein